MNVFITGIAGFLGSNLSHYLSKKGYNVFGVDNLVGGKTTNVSNKATAWIADCKDIDEISSYLEMAKPEIIIHTACYPHEGLSVFSPNEICDSVINGTTSVLSTAINLRNKNKIPFCKFINMSSMARYGESEKWENKYREFEDCSPVDPYGACKFAAEKIVQSLAYAHKFSFVNLVPHNIYGPRQCYTDPYRNVVSIMINRAIHGGPVYIYGDGKQTRCFTYVDDIMPQIEFFLKTNTHESVYNIGPDTGGISINDLAMLINMKVRSVLNNTPEIIHIEDRPNEVKHAICSSDLIRTCNIDHPKTSLIDGISKTFDWIYQDIKNGADSTFDYYAHSLEIESNLTPKTWRNKI